MNMVIHRRVASLGAMLLLGMTAAAQPGAGRPPVRVHVDSVRLETVERQREVTGEIRTLRRALVASEEAGLVVELTVDVGSVVEEGEVMARLKDDRRRLDLVRLEAEARGVHAEVEERQAQVAKAERDLGRLESLQAQAGASANEVDDAITTLAETRARLAQAEGELASAEAEVETARTRLGDMVILAPFDGSVVNKSTEVGQWLREGDTVIELVGLQRLVALLDVPERFIGRLRVGESIVRLQLDAIEDVIDAPVASIVAQGDRLARTFPVLVYLDNEEGLLRPGMSVRAMVPTGEPIEALTVHKDAIMRSEVGIFVWLNAEGQAQKVSIEPLFARRDRMIVRSVVLKPGMMVVTEGNETLSPGEPLLVENQADAAPGANAVSRGDE